MGYIFDRVKKFELGAKPVKAGVNVKTDEFQAIDVATGLLVPFDVAVETATPGTYGDVYIPVNNLDNTLGADGFIGVDESERYVQVYQTGTVGVVQSAGLAQTDIGADVYVASANTVSKVALGVAVGKIINVLSATNAEIMLY